MLRCCAVGLLLLGLPALVGCSGNSKTAGKVSVSGSVSVKGVPLADGVVLFEPLEKQNTSASAVLVGSNFSISAANGLQPGMYLVRVSTSGEENKPVDPNAPLTPSGSNLPGSNKSETKKPTIPPEWGGKSKQQVEIKADGPNKFDFDIK
ncbi:hypothetical protein GobsT_48200 [Gemmata obscuriglobus]|uniref:Carboxypeptidase regulatory-like domain-containing protein n=1 Tax=Gemmata obscuriglobus TaxID=114 RepID=A0A2Z3H0Y5_9BACT|nr:hypothetical protein [Gemmata obscuriglobus]AWM37236.1 hypothetical protein C1280_09505 [Gemmata obscuriglobus]QEG30020.1 hypothetical protein GobsT_48200 [Gemmata obscuriglobus]VTS09341.1 Uncharacterized protein OS=Blastopirellula marina DSM 3645 GN=DSM3645_16730 PE=4 SV=1 [Gemmata obscuriglobus UQM 2246]